MPVVARNDDGRFEIFIVGQNRQLYHRWQMQPNDGWYNTWLSLGGDWPSMPVVASDVYGRFEIFALGNYGQLYEKYQVEPDDGWSNGWSSFVDRPAGSLPVVARDADGRLEVFILGGLGDRAGKLYHKWQLDPLGPWSFKWEEIGGLTMLLTHRLVDQPLWSPIIRATEWFSYRSYIYCFGHHK